MKLVIQRVKKSKVEVDGEITGKIEHGLMILVGVEENDSEQIVEQLATKVCNLRVFSDEEGKMNKSIRDVNGAILAVSQFTLYADCTKGNRPSFGCIKGGEGPQNAGTEKAERLYKYFMKQCKKNDIDVQMGRFGADMQVSIVNDGPVTIILERNNEGVFQT